MASGAAAAGAAMDNAANKMRDCIVGIVTSHWFDKEDFNHEKLKLSQAFCLLWQDPESGEVSGRKMGVECNVGATAAAILDLIVMNRVEIELESNTTLGVKDDNIWLKVINEKPTDTFLDGPLFDEIVKHHNKNPDKPQKLKKVIFWDIGKVMCKNQVGTVTLDSLVDIGVLEMKEKLVGRKYPTVKPGVEDSLRDQIRSVVLDDAEPNSYIHSLLLISRISDRLHLVSEPVLKKCFSKDEYGRAKDKLDAMLDSIKAEGSAKYKKI